MSELDQHKSDGVRLQKILANSNVASRRASEQLIKEGRIEVNSVIVTELGTRVDPIKDEIRFDGKIIKLNEDNITIALNKPKNVLSAMIDEQGRTTVADLIGDKYGRLFHIGRLDYDSEGLILLTNDGDLAQKISHPSSELPKKYVVKVNGKLSSENKKLLLDGLELSDGFSKFDKLKLIAQNSEESVFEVILHSGKNRIIRRMFNKVNHKVTKLVRVEIGPIRIGELKTGKTRVLSNQEIISIEAQVNSLSKKNDQKKPDVTKSFKKKQPNGNKIANRQR